MIALLAAVALLQQAPALPAVITVRAGERTGSIPVVSTRLGAMVRGDEALSPLGAVLLRDSAERYRLVLGGVEIQLTPGLAFARVRGVTHPLGSPPAVLEGRLYLPLSLLTDLLPRVATGFLYDPALAEIRRFTPVAGARARDEGNGRVAAKAPPPASAPASQRPIASPSPARAARARRPVVVVDAGHGGRDRGMRGPLGSRRPVYEADITLSVARHLRDELRRRGAEVVMTRSADTLIALSDRGRIANRAGGELFISIHVNAANPRWRNPGGARGFETYFLSEAKTDDERRVADLENEARKYEVEAEAGDGDALSFILNDMKQNEFLRESSDLAETVQGALRRVHPGTDRGVKQAGFVVLVGAFMPSVLVEIGFGTNASEAAYMSGDAGQRQLASAIADAAMDYLERYATRRAGGASR
ncbi:MAG TPA: N-acetylmuramoyl-L-alanine amidase [Gemmatimonadaceae bacterium]|nr:N-acetylmuramoyl-L-alanine amidase [Gemmatimonadaceae bacterium]